MSNIITLQHEISQPIPLVIGNSDYTNFKNSLARMNELLSLSEIDNKIMQYDLDEAEKKVKKDAKQNNKIYRGLSYKQKIRIQNNAKKKIRYAILRKYTGESFRDFSIHLAESHLVQNFCLIETFGKIFVPSKSSLDRFEKNISAEIIRELVNTLTNAASSPIATDEEKQKLLLAKEMNNADIYLDATCIKANVHYPVDWVLLRDATRTLIKAIILIRKNGLKNRMEEPSIFINKINKLCIQMTHTRNKKESKRKRKIILRLMKKLLKKVRTHGEKYKNLLQLNWEQTQLSKNEKDRIINRMENILNKLPDAIKQAHERIIGGRAVKNSDKIFSFYDPEIHVLTRGKPEAKIEFGNTLVIGELKNGYIIDWEYYRDKIPADAKLIIPTLHRLEENFNGYKPKSITTDRGCDSASNKKYLEKNGIKNYMCPKSVVELNERLNEENFRYHQKRRGQTEARIGIVKNVFVGLNPLKSKIFDYKKRNIGLAILTHNLWLLARLPKNEEEDLQEQNKIA